MSERLPLLKARKQKSIRNVANARAPCHVRFRSAELLQASLAYQFPVPRALSHVFGQVRAPRFSSSQVHFSGSPSSAPAAAAAISQHSRAEMTVITPDSQGYSHSNGAAAAEEDIVNIANAYDTM